MIYKSKQQSNDLNNRLYNKYMQAEAKAQRKRKQEVLKLVNKIRRLKNKLLSYGLTSKDSIDAILYEFLKAPQIDWTLPHNTVIFYQIQSKYHTDHSTAELILLLNAIVPNWEARNVVEYLHQTLTYNALSFGIDLQISDDSSNQDASDMTLMLIKAKKKNSQFGLKPKKRNHLSTGSSNVLIYNSLKDLPDSDEQLKKKVHFNQKMQEFKPERKPTEQNLDDFPSHGYFTSYHSTINENAMSYSNQQKPMDLAGLKRQQTEEKQEKPVRSHPVEAPYLEDQKLEKKVKQ